MCNVHTLVCVARYDRANGHNDYMILTLLLVNNFGCFSILGTLEHNGTRTKYPIFDGRMQEKENKNIATYYEHWKFACEESVKIALFSSHGTSAASEIECSRERKTKNA